MVAGVSLQNLSVLLMNQAVFPLFDGVFTYARDMSIIFSAIFLAGLSVATMRRPQLVHGRAFDVACAVLCLVTFAGVMTGVAHDWAWLLVPCACVAALCRSWSSVVVNMALASAPGSVTPCIIAGVLVGSLLDGALALLPAWAGAALAFVVLPWVALLLCARPAERLMDAIAAVEPAADLAITRPASFVPLSSTLYVFQLIVYVTFGFALRFGETGGSPAFNVFLGALAVAILLVVTVIRQGRMSIDALCNCVVIVLVAGMALAATSPGASDTATMILAVGNAFNNVFISCMVVMLARRKRYASLASFGWTSGISGVGATRGAFVGTTANGLVASDRSETLSLVIVLLLTLFVAYVLFALRGYSFSTEIGGVVEPAPVAVEVAPHGEEQFAARCHQIAQEFGLTPREEEVFAMLARGRNREHIESALQVSRNTVKAHVKHVYAKLGIHSHQELIDRVEQAG